MLEPKPKLRIIVDECAGPTSPLVQQFQTLVASGKAVEWVPLSEHYPGIPDGEILRRILGQNTILLTNDRVLHNQACALGFRSYTLDEAGNLQRRPLKQIPTPPPLAVREKGLRDNYVEPPNPVATVLKGGFSEHEFKRYKTRRRRIRSYFGAASNITSVSVTIGARPARRGLMCGYFLALAGSSGVRGLRASEGYGLVPGPDRRVAYPLLHALPELFLLQLERIPTEIFVIPGDALILCQQLLTAAPGSDGHPAVSAVATLLQGLAKVRVLPCVKGRFYDAMQGKLEQLENQGSNELTRFDPNAIIAALQSVGQIPRVASEDDPF